VAGTACADGTSIRWAEEVGALRQSTEGRLSVLDDALRAQAQRRRLRRGVRAVAMLLLVVLVGLVLGPGRQSITGVARTGAVAGYIQPCEGRFVPLYTSTGARVFSAAATVEALRGREYLKPLGGGNYQMVFPAVVAARERVSQNQQFRFDHLSPGRYVILARYTGGDASTWLDVSVAASKTAGVDLPNVCM
jgi:hypothetical protein